MSDSEQQIRQLVADGWRVFSEWDSEDGAAYCIVGLSRNKSLGIEGCSYCEHIAAGQTQHEALEAAVAKAVAAGEARHG